MKNEIKELRKAAQAVHLACEESVALDLSKKLTWAANRIEELEEKNTDMSWELNPEKMGR